MKSKIIRILQNSFYQLLIIYTLLVFFISINSYFKYSIHFELFAILLGILGFFIIQKTDKLPEIEVLKNKKVHYLILTAILLIILNFHVIPYVSNSIPLGYDTGMYKYAIEHGLQNLDNWVLQGVEPGFLYLMKPLSMIFSSQFILTWLLVILSIILGLGIYFASSSFFNKTTGLFAILLYAFSLIQYKTFELMYYKNIMGLILILFALYFFNKKNNYLFIILAGLAGTIHRPTFYIFGLSYFFYAFISPYKNKYNFKQLGKNILSGILILIIAILPFLGKFRVALTSVMPWVLQGFTSPGQSPGTFINIFTFQFLTLAYLPFAILGLLYLIKKRNFNILFFWAIINSIIVYFQFFFFNRFIIHLDIALILLASLGFSILLEKRKKLATILLIFLFASMFFTSISYIKTSSPLISETELNIIKIANSFEKNAIIMTTNSIYSPWLQGYVNRKIIAPGLFDYNKHNESQWQEFWTTKDLSKIKQFMNYYEKPLYIFIGEQQQDNIKQFPTCFDLIIENQNNKLYKYTC